MKIRKAQQRDFKNIQTIEKEYYQGYSCPEIVLRNWIKSGRANFLVAEDTSEKLSAFLFLEAIKAVKSLPFIHKSQNKSGEYLYASEIGILNKYTRTNLLNDLFKKLLKQNKEKKGVVWVTGGKSKHDKVELRLLKKEGFKRLKRIARWEAYPNYFVNNHWIWFKRLPNGF